MAISASVAGTFVSLLIFATSYISTEHFHTAGTPARQAIYESDSFLNTEQTAMQVGPGSYKETWSNEFKGRMQSHGAPFWQAPRNKCWPSKSFIRGFVPTDVHRQHTPSERPKWSSLGLTSNDFTQCEQDSLRPLHESTASKRKTVENKGPHSSSFTLSDQHTCCSNRAKRGENTNHCEKLHSRGPKANVRSGAR